MVFKRGKYFRVFSWISKPLVSIVVFFEYIFFFTCSEENYASNEWSIVNFGQKMPSLAQINVVLGFCLINKPPKISKKENIVKERFLIKITSIFVISLIERSKKHVF